MADTHPSEPRMKYVGVGSLHNSEEIKTEESAEKLQRKREAARIRQQRCRARKRAAAAALESKLDPRGRGRLHHPHPCQVSEGHPIPLHVPRSHDTSPIAIKRGRSSKLMVPTPTENCPPRHGGMILTTPVNTSHSHYRKPFSPVENTTPLPLHRGHSAPPPPQTTGAPHHPYYMAPWYHHHHPAHTGHWAMPPPNHHHHHPYPHPMNAYPMPHPIPPSSSTHHSSASSTDSPVEKEATPPVGSQSHNSMVPPVTVSSTPKSSPLHHSFFPFASPLLPTPTSTDRVLLGLARNVSSLPATTPIKPSKELELEVNRSFGSDIST